jgi:hypothetical protein
MTNPAVLARRAYRVLALLVLAVAVVAMHSLGAGHDHLAPAHPGTDPPGHAAEPIMAAMSHHGDEPVVLAAAPTTAMVLAAAPEPGAACGDACRVAAGDEAGHLMGAVCLAVLSSLLVLVLLLALRARGRRNRITAAEHWVRWVAPRRGPPRRVALSLAQVCVLRT